MNVADFAVKYWVLITALFMFGSSWGIGWYKVDQIQKQMENKSFTDPRVTDLIQQQAVTDAKLEAIHQSIRDQQQLQQQILNNLLGQ